MNKYENGKIYTIRSPHTDKYYICSTIASLKKHFYQHKSGLYKSKEIIDAGDAYIELLENFPCKSKNELEKREGELLRQFKNEIVNYRNCDQKYKIKDILNIIETKADDGHNEDRKEFVNELKTQLAELENAL
jgi:hypothetical protein